MKIRAVIAGLALLVVVFCPVAPSQAAKSNLHNINFMPPADEHPWQHGDAPDPGGDPGAIWAARHVILQITPGLRVVLSVPAVRWVRNSAMRTSGVNVTEPDNENPTGAR